MERKLAAILAADIAGYSRLMGADEEATLKALQSHRFVVDALIAAHRGRIFNTAGDSVIAEFPSAVEASLCAVQIQQEIARRNEAVPKDKRLEFRIGVNIGDVVDDGGNLLGDGVNVTDRVQKQAAPGGICVSRNVHDQLRNQAGFVLEPMGEHKVKNIAAPVAIYRVLTDNAARRPWISGRLAPFLRSRRRIIAVTAAVVIVILAAVWMWLRPQTVPMRTGFPSVAIQAFQNLSGDPALGSFAEGVTQDLTTVLSRFPDLTVVSPELKADYVVEGSVQKRGGALRLNAQLIDPQNNAHIWAESYDGADPSALQDDAVRKIAFALASHDNAIRTNEYLRIKNKPRSAFGEYDYFLSGDEITARAEDIETHDRGGAIWKEGLGKFADSGLLKASLAGYYFTRPWNFDTEMAAADFRLAGELARDALSGQHLSPSVRWRAYWMAAYAAWFDADFVKAVAAAEEAVALAPYDPNTLSFLARIQVAAGNTSRGLEWVQESMRRGPTIPRNTRLLAWIYYLTGDYEKSIDAAKKHNALSRSFAPDANGYMVASYVRLGRLDEARAALKQALEAEPGWNQLRERSVNLSRPYKDRSIADRELADLAAAGLPELPFGYDAKPGDRLTGQEIKSLTFGHTLRGHDEKSGASYTDVVATDGSFTSSGDFGTDSATLLYLGDRVICYRSTKWEAWCSAILRNPDGTSAGQDEFIWVDGWTESRFSVVK